MMYMELTRKELEDFRDEADVAGNEKSYQYYCRKLDELDHEEEL